MDVCLFLLLFVFASTFNESVSAARLLAVGAPLRPGMSNSRPDVKQEEGTIMESVTETPAATICG